MHSDPLRQIKLLNAESKGQHIEDIVTELRKIEDQKRQQRKTGFIRLFGKSISPNADTQQFQLKQSSKVNIQRIRQYSYDANIDAVRIKEYPCFCAVCLNGRFDDCQLFKQKIINVFIEKRHVSQANIEEIDLDDGDLEQNLNNDSWKQDPNLSIDIDFLNNEHPEEFNTEESGDNPDSKNVNTSFQSDACSSQPDKGQKTSSQTKKNIPDLQDFGPLDVSMSDYDYVQNRINNMMPRQSIKPAKYIMEKQSLNDLFKRTGLLDGFTLNYLGNMFTSQSQSTDCYIFDPQIADYLRLPAKNRPVDWVRSLTTHNSERFASAERIIIPWNHNRNHWTVIYLKCQMKTIQYFDSCREPPRYTDMKSIIKFFEVNFMEIYICD